MDNTKIKDFFTKLGLSSKETLVYLYCLNHGPQLASRLAKVIGTTRTNTYDVIKKLEEKGMCHSVGSSYGKKIKSNKVEYIENILKEKEESIKSMRMELDSLLPFLNDINNQKFSPYTKVSYFEGKDSVCKMLNESLNNKNKIIKIAGSELDMGSNLGLEFIENFHKRRKIKDIKLNALRPDSKRINGDIFSKNSDNLFLREIRIRPKGKVRLKSNLIIWDEYIAIYSLKDKIIFGTMIESEEIAIMFDSWFDFVWNESKKITK